MNKKLIAMTTSMVVGGSLLLTTAFVNAAQLSGYETYKAAIKNTHSIKSGTGKLDLTVTDNGANLAKVTSNMKAKLDSKAMSGETNITVGTENQTMTMFNADGKSVMKSSNSDVYKVREMNAKHKDVVKNEDTKMVDSIERVVDALVGNMKDNVVASDKGDGTKEITIDLNENQFPPLVNAVVSMIGSASNHRGEGITAEKDGKSERINLKDALPKLTDAVKIEKVQVTAEINKDNIIESQHVIVTLSGNDATGKAHEVVADANMSLTDINNTTPDTIDLTGKKVETLKAEFHGKKESKAAGVTE